MSYTLTGQNQFAKTSTSDIIYVTWHQFMIHSDLEVVNH